MDNVDSIIINFLEKDSRMPFIKIAKELKLSEGTIRKRVKDLVNDGKIKKFTIETKDNVFAIVGIQTQTKTETKKIVESIKKYDLMEIYEVTGRFDIICMIPSKDREKVNDILEKIRCTQGVMHTETFTVLVKS